MINLTSLGGRSAAHTHAQLAAHSRVTERRPPKGHAPRVGGMGQRKTGRGDARRSGVPSNGGSLRTHALACSNTSTNRDRRVKRQTRP